MSIQNRFNRDRLDTQLLFWDNISLGIGAAVSEELNVTTGEGAIIQLVCSAVSGTSPTLNVEVQGSPDGVDWIGLGTLGVIEDEGEIRFFALPINDLRQFRLAPTVGGSDTPVVTVSAWLAY